jgi:hypothetical protein
VEKEVTLIFNTPEHDRQTVDPFRIEKAQKRKMTHGGTLKADPPMEFLRGGTQRRMPITLDVPDGKSEFETILFPGSQPFSYDPVPFRNNDIHGDLKGF